METPVLNAVPRQTKGRGPNNRLRDEGFVPGVIYGGSADPVTVAIQGGDIRSVIVQKMSRAVLNVKVEGADDQRVVIRDLQHDPVTLNVMHIDLLRVEKGHRVEQVFEIYGKGVPTGVREGGRLERPLREVEVRCLPDDLPEIIEIDISKLSLNDYVRVCDLQEQLGEQVKILTEQDQILFHVVSSRIAAAGMELETETEGEEGAEGQAEPEVIGEEKEDGGKSGEKSE